LTLISTLSLIFSISGPAYAATAPAHSDAPDATSPVRVADKAQFEAAEAVQVVENPLKGATEGIFVIRLNAEPLATYRGGIVGLAPTSPVVTGDAKLDTASVASRAYVDYLESSQATFVTRLEKAIGHTADVRYNYKYSTNGLAVWMTPSEAARVARMPGVESVRQEVIEQLNTDAGPTYIGAPAIWGGTACTAGGNCGEGVIVGVLDTGINPSNPSFADPGPVDAYDYPAPAGGYLGVCDAGDPSYDATFPCNDKLIGAWDFTASSAVDDDGHGSHTASTAAGNFVAASIIGPTLTAMHDISGVAPHANIIAYRVCDAGGCPSAGTIAAIDQSILDGVDVINFSVGSPSPENPWVSDSQQAWLGAREAGIAVAHSAGNEGPDAATVGSPQPPWMMHVAATTHNRRYANSVGTMTGGDTTPPADIGGAGFTSGYGPANIVYAGDYPSALTDAPELCGVGDLGDEISPWPAGTFSGEIVVCDRGAFGRVEKGTNALAAGAGGMVLVDNGSGLVGDAHDLPAVHITAEDGVPLKTWLATGTGHVATIGGAILDTSAANGDILAGFSSRGPNRSVPDMISPSVAAPGVDIIAADGIGDEVSWGFNSGTSMASPHAAGALALLVADHPTWTPAQLQSALMTTGTTDVLREDGVTPADWFDQGSGRIQVDQATQAGLVLDIDNAAFTAADPATGGDPSSLNLPSMANSQCVVECEWTRTVTATTAGTWTAAATAAEIDLGVSPASFTLAIGETQDLTITAGVAGLPNNVWIFGDVTLSAAGVPDTLMPVAVAPSTGSMPASVDIATRRDAGSQVVTDLTAIEITQLTIETAGLTIGSATDLALAEDSDNGNAFDDLADGVFWTTVEVGAGAWRLVAETYDSESPDLDLYVGTGDTPSDASTVCTSASGSAAEFCDVTNPAAGTYWILVQNWSGSGADMDGFTLSHAVVAADEGNLLIEGPAQHPQLDPFDVRLLFNEPDLVEGDRAYGAFSIGTNPAKPGNVGTVPVNLARLGNDVVKTVDPGTAEPGDTLTHTITVEPNPTGTAIAYELIDFVPEGVTYVPGSATGGLSLRSDGALTWSGVMPAAQEPFYTVTDSVTDPLCDTGFGGYADLKTLAGFLADSSITGDTVAFTAFTSVTGHNPFNFYGSTYDGASFTDDGYAFWADGYTDGDPTWLPQTLPDPTFPNNLLAGLWHDYELFYDAGTNSGVTLATAGPDLAIIEYDNLQPWGGGAPLLDMELVLASTQVDAPGWYEAVVAFDNIGGDVPTAIPDVPAPLVGTIGAENADGSAASVYLNNDDAHTVISDGHMVCFDLTAVVSEAVVLTYDVTVDPGTEGTVITNEVSHSVDTIGGATETSSVDVAIGDVTPPTDGANLWATDVLSSSLTLMWDAATDDRAVTGYGIYQDGVHLDDVTTETMYDVMGLTPDTEYDFTVKAMDAQGNVSTGLMLDVMTSTDFTDDDFSIFEDDIEWLFSAGITKGCNPPVNDQFCPNDNLTRGQLAAMLNRGLDLPAASMDYFTDDDDSVFEDDINAVAATGITLGCNPPANDNFCPGDFVSRGQLAAMFDRALDLPATTTDYFTDDDDNIFEDSINSLAEAGITRGCNPPDNDQYCPTNLLTRGQAAAFFRRALG
jgi:uncharacterized repeat protein (TIGR01451 family)